MTFPFIQTVEISSLECTAEGRGLLARIESMWKMAEWAPMSLSGYVMGMYHAVDAWGHADEGTLDELWLLAMVAMERGRG